MATKPDRPSNVRTLQQLEIDGAPEQYRFALPGGKGIITFPDPGEMDWEEAEAFMQSIEQAGSRETLARWLSADDFQKLLNAKLKARQLVALMRDVTRHYESFFGTAPEGDGSTES